MSRVATQTVTAAVWRDVEGWYACRTGSRRSWTLSASDETRVSHPRLAGHYVAYGLTLIGMDVSQTTVMVADLRTGGIRHDIAPVTGASRPERRNAGTRVHRLFLRRDGAGAWEGELYDRRRVLARQIGSTGGSLATGLDIERGSLRVAAGRATWRQGGVTRHATLRR